MTNAELLAKIKAEIERRIADNSFGAKLELIDILTWLSDLEKSLPAKVADGEELENELVRFYLKDLCASEDDELTDATRHHHFPIMWDDLRDIARHFYELGKRSGSSEKPSEGLEEEIHKYNKERFDEYFPEQDGDFISEVDFMTCLDRVARHFAQWGAEHLK